MSDKGWAHLWQKLPGLWFMSRGSWALTRLQATSYNLPLGFWRFMVVHVSGICIRHNDADQLQSSKQWGEGMDFCTPGNKSGPPKFNRQLWLPMRAPMLLSGSRMVYITPASFSVSSRCTMQQLKEKREGKWKSFLIDLLTESHPLGFVISAQLAGRACTGASQGGLLQV